MMASLSGKARITRALMVKTICSFMIVAGGLAIGALYVKYEAYDRIQHARDALTAELGIRADKIQDWLLRVDRTLAWFRPEDLSIIDRVATKVRMLQNERFVAPADDLVLFSTTGQLLAATLPFLEGDGNVAEQPWFKAIQAGPPTTGLQITGCARNSVGTSEGVMLYRTIYDHDAVMGYIGSFLPQAAIAPLSRDDNPTDGTITLSLQTASGQVFGCGVPQWELEPRQHASVLQSALSRMIHRSATLAAKSAIEGERLIQPGNLHLVARADAIDSISDEEWLALTYRASYVAISLLTIMALSGGMLRRLSQSRRRRALAPAAIPAADAADWMWELDAAGNLVGLAGNAPDHLLPPNGRSLAEAAGPIGSSDMRWDRLNASICCKQAFEGLLVPFQLPGREGLLTIFELSGQPVLSSGGFWGTASLISEESIGRAREPRMVGAELSAA